MKSTESGISLWVDDFDDIYSDFDSRHYLKRRVSEDFLHELALSMAYNETKASELVLLIPPKRRNLETERHIVSSLAHFFQKQAVFHKELCRKTFVKGLTLLMAGIALMTVNFVLNYHFNDSLLLSLLRVLAEPGSWFLVWAALDTLYYDLTKLRKKRAHFRHLAELKLHFKSAE